MIEVSVIIPTFNNKRLLRLTLYTLEKQTFDLSKVEVIVVDDGSTDGTRRKLASYRPPYAFQFIRCNRNIGRSAARNQGIRAASGRVLIFLDAEVLVEPEFIEQHMRYHAGSENVVVAGVLGRYHGLYSMVHPRFSKRQLAHCYGVTRRSPYIRRRCRSAHMLRRWISERRKPKMLVDRAGIDRRRYHRLAFKKRFFKPNLAARFGPRLEGFHLPWLSFLTGNVSVTKESVIAAGLFDENFIGHGFEDWELGYRLFRGGAQFVAGEEIVSYHQEHPLRYKARYREYTANHLRFYNKHRDIGIALVALHLMRWCGLPEISQAAAEYEQLCQEFPGLFTAFKTALHQYSVRLLKIRATTDRRHTAAALVSDEFDPVAWSQYTQLKSTGRFPQLTAVFELIG